MMNQDLIVVHEHLMTPTAQLADYILPGDSWLERQHLWDGYGWIPFAQASREGDRAARRVPGRLRLLARAGGAHGPGRALSLDRPSRSVLDHRLQRIGQDVRGVRREQRILHAARRDYRKYEKTGFATPSGKVELSFEHPGRSRLRPAALLARRPPQPDAEFPLTLFVGRARRRVLPHRPTARRGAARAEAAAKDVPRTRRTRRDARPGRRRLGRSGRRRKAGR